MADDSRVTRTKRPWWYWLGIGLAVDAVVFGLPVVFAPQLLSGAASLFGYHVRLDSVHVGLHDAIIKNVRLAQDGGSLIATEVHVQYKPLAVEITKPIITIVHHADGRWELPVKLPQSAPSAGKSAPGGLPKDPFALHMTDAELILLAPEADHPTARRVAITHVAVDGNYAPNGQSRLVASAHSGAAALELTGSSNLQDGTVVAHLRAQHLGLTDIAGALINRPEFIIDAGTIDDLDWQLIGTGAPGSTPPVHLAGTAQLRDAAFRVVGLAAPVTQLNGRLDLADGGITSSALDGTIARTPVHISGGITELTAPQLRLAIRTDGRAENLRKALSVAATQPVRGRLDVAVKITGPLTGPLILADVQSPALYVNALEFAQPHVRIALVGDTLTVLDGTIAYGPLSATAAGTARLGALADALFFLHLRGTAGALDANLRLQDRGGAVAINGTSDAGTLAVLGTLAPDRGNGALALVADGAPGHRGIGHVRIDDKMIVAGLAAHDFRASDLFGSLNGGFAMAKYLGSEWYAADIDLRDPQTRAILAAVPQLPPAAIPTAVRVRGGGDPRALEIDQAEILGAPYRITASGIAGREQAELSGMYRADVGAFTPFAHGRIAGPFAVIAQQGALVAASPTSQISDGSLGGVPWTSVAATVRTGKQLRIAATTSLAGGQATVWGEQPGRLYVQVADIALAQIPQARTSAVQAAGVLDAAGWLEGKTAQAGAVVHDGGVHDIAAGAIADVQHADTQTTVRRAALRLGTALTDITGSLIMDGSTPSYRAHAHMAGAELGPVIAAFVPKLAPLEPQIALNADAAIDGRGTAPNVQAQLRMPLGSINGLPLRRGRARITTNGTMVRITRGNLLAGRSQMRFSGEVAPNAGEISVRAPFLDIRELADTASPGSTIRGTGDFTVRARLAGHKLTSDGGFGISDVRFDDISLGNTSGNWRTSGAWITGHLIGGGATTRVTVDGRIAPELTDALALAPATRLELDARLANFDIADHLATFGVHAPLTGTIDATASARGTIARPKGDVQAKVHDGTIYGLALSTAHIAASVTERDVRLRDLQISAQGLAVQATGILRGFTAHAPLALEIRGTSDRIGELIARVTGKTVPISGAVSSTVTVNGSIAKPAILGAVALDNGKFARLAVPSALGRFAITKKSLEISDAEINLEQGSITAGGALPLTLAPFGIGPASAPLALTIGFNEIDLAKLGLLTADEGTLRGLITGAVALEGTASDPRVVGAVRLRNGSVAVKGQPANVDAVNGLVRFAGTAATLDTKANVGGGRIAISGRAAVPDLTDVTSLHSDSSLNVRVQADHARFSLASLGGATIDGQLELARVPETPAALTGDLTVSDAAVPLSALLAQQPPATGDGGFIGRTTLDLGIHVPKGARVRSGAIDLGATGDVQVGGRIAAPSLNGAFVATGGTVTYANRSFRVQRGRVDFDKADGIEPQVDAIAVTNIQRSDPSSPGQVTITLEVHGRPNHLNIALNSQPSYSRDQILAMLVGADVLGGLAENSSGGSSSSTGGSNASGQGALQNEAVSLLNAQFGQSLLAPITSALGGAVGLSDLGVNVGAGGSFGLTARRNITGNLSIFFEEALGIPARQSIGLDVTPNLATALRFSIYQERNAVGTGRAASGSAIFTPNRLTPVSASSSSGQTTSGVSLSVQRRLP